MLRKKEAQDCSLHANMLRKTFQLCTMEGVALDTAQRLVNTLEEIFCYAPITRATISKQAQDPTHTKHGQGQTPHIPSYRNTAKGINV